VPPGVPSASSGQRAPSFSCALSTEAVTARALRAALDELDAGLAGIAPDLVLAFATHHHGHALEGLGAEVARASGAPLVAGCTAESVIGGDQEAEGRPGIALWAAHLPGTRLSAFEVDARAGEGGEARFSRLPPVGSDEASVLLLADPFTFPADAYLVRLNQELPGIPVMGGMASGAMGPGQTMFFHARGLRDSGAVGVVLEGETELVSVVSQGCRPIGKPWVITQCERNQIQKLGGKPALEVLMETLNELGCKADRPRQSMPFLGLAIDPARTQSRGDFLVRGIMALNHRDRSMAVADFVRRGQTVQLLVRDAGSADEDLVDMLARRIGPVPEERRGATGALLFSCNGRGRRMFGRPDHDAGCVRAGLASAVPLAGFFAAGEIGPVGGRNFLHGFTASLALFRARS
jgi:small ligand-binding sensory domain FIST